MLSKYTIQERGWIVGGKAIDASNIKSSKQTGEHKNTITANSTVRIHCLLDPVDTDKHHQQREPPTKQTVRIRDTIGSMDKKLNGNTQVS